VPGVAPTPSTTWLWKSLGSTWHIGVDRPGPLNRRASAARADMPLSVMQRGGEVGYRRDRVCQPEKVPKPVDAVGQLFIGPDRECQI
jgi:hypothetical protein